MSKHELDSCISYLLLHNESPHPYNNKTFLISQFLWVRFQDRAHWILWLRVRHEAVVEVLAGAVVPSEGTTGEGSIPHSLTWVLARSSLLWAVGLRLPVPH